MLSVLNIRDENGNFIPIPAIRGDDGKSAYEQAKEGGYKGTEDEFIAILNGITKGDVNTFIIEIELDDGYKTNLSYSEIERNLAEGKIPIIVNAAISAV